MQNLKIGLLFLFGAVSCCLIGCVNFSYLKKPPHIPRYITNKYSLSRMDNVVIDGPVNVVIVNAKNRSLIISGMDNVLAKYDVSIIPHGVYIKVPLLLTNKYQERINISAPFLNKLVLINGVNVWANYLHVSNLELTTTSNSDCAGINLRGQIFAAITKIHQQKDGKISVGWLDSEKIDVNSLNGGVVWLSGEADTLTGNMSSSSYLDSKYFRVSNIRIRANGISRADIFPLGTLRAFTSDRGNVFYYNRPENIFINSIKSGNVLMIP